MDPPFLSTLLFFSQPSLFLFLFNLGSEFSFRRLDRLGSKLCFLIMWSGVDAVIVSIGLSNSLVVIWLAGHSTPCDNGERQVLGLQFNGGNLAEHDPLFLDRLWPLYLLACSFGIRFSHPTVLVLVISSSAAWLPVDFASLGLQL